jgi:hypothetical protein
MKMETTIPAELLDLKARLDQWRVADTLTSVQRSFGAQRLYHINARSAYCRQHRGDDRHRQQHER